MFSFYPKNTCQKFSQLKKYKSIGWLPKLLKDHSSSVIYTNCALPIENWLSTAEPQDECNQCADKWAFQSLHIIEQKNALRRQ
jgi:hypothetical protein